MGVVPELTTRDDNSVSDHGFEHQSHAQEYNINMGIDKWRSLMHVFLTSFGGAVVTHCRPHNLLNTFFVPPELIRGTRSMTQSVAYSIPAQRGMHIMHVSHIEAQTARVLGGTTLDAANNDGHALFHSKEPTRRAFQYTTVLQG